MMKAEKGRRMSMKRILAVLMCMSLLMLAGCSDAGSSSSEPESQQSSSSQAEESSSEPEESTPEEAIAPAVQEMMEALAVYQPGTAGSSLKAYIAACGVLNYAEEYDSSGEETLRSSAAAWLEQADELTLECLQEGWEAVQSTAEEILTGSEESKAMLADAGNPNRYESYDAARYEEVSGILGELLEQ